LGSVSETCSEEVEEAHSRLGLMLENTNQILGCSIRISSNTNFDVLLCAAIKYDPSA
jgi:hypothetical protein